MAAFPSFSVYPGRRDQDHEDRFGRFGRVVICVNQIFHPSDFLPYSPPLRLRIAVGEEKFGNLCFSHRLVEQTLPDDELQNCSPEFCPT